jgi:hypothetical protein
MTNDAAAPNTVILSPEGIEALTWLRDHKHHLAQILVNGREPTFEHPAKWTHMELRGRLGRIRISRAAWAETAPYRTISTSADRMFEVTPAGLDLLKEVRS